MRKVLLLMLAAAVIAVPAALAGSAHFVGTPTISTSGSTATASGKIAGLGNITQIHVVVRAEAACVNGGNNKPKAANKQTVENSSDEPVQNGKANFSVTLSATFQPPCDPPMTVQWSLISITVFDVNGTQLIP